MKYEEPRVEVLKQPKEEVEIYKHIESVARTCYMSFDYTTDDSYIRLINKFKSEGHIAMLEHANIIIRSTEYNKWNNLVNKLKLTHHFLNFTNYNGRYLISGNITAFRNMFIERKLDDELLFLLKNKLNLLFDDIPYICKDHNFETFYTEKFTLFNNYEIVKDTKEFITEEIFTHCFESVRFINVQRGFTHEQVRMRGVYMAWKYDLLENWDLDQFQYDMAYINETEGINEAIKHMLKFIENLKKYNELYADGMSFAQKSTRYVDEYKKIKNITFIRCPEQITEEMQQVFDKVYETAEWGYMKLRELGLRPELARDVLSIGVESEIVVSGHLKNWYHTLKLRTSKYAHPSMRKVMIPVLAQFRKIYPNIFDNIGV